MKISTDSAEIELVKGDISGQVVDAIVTAANKRLAGGGGVDDAIHYAAGPSIMNELKRRYPNGCSVGEAVITGAGRLKSRFLIHAVGPVYTPLEREWCADRLRSAYLRSFQLAAEYECRSIAFPSIGTGMFHYPTAEAARLAFQVAVDFLSARNPLETIRWVLFDDRTFEAFQDAARELSLNFLAEDNL
jgi:O-acetyl-ADP-ribose deacetylase